jgi:hypothetical protein
LIIILINIFPVQRKQGKKLLLAVAVFGICIIIYAVSKIFWIGSLSGSI